MFAKKITKMIRFLTLHVMLLGALAKIDKRPVIRIPKELSDNMAAVTYKCMRLFGTRSATIRNFYEFNFPDDDRSKEFLYCACYTTYLATADGHLSETMLGLFDHTDYEEEVKKVFETCNKINAKKVVQTLYEVVKCFHKKSPAILGPPSEIAY